MVSTRYPPPANSNSLQLLTIEGITGTGTLEAGTTVPSGDWTGGVNLYHGVLIQTGVNACNPKQVWPMSLRGTLRSVTIQSQNSRINSRIPVVKLGEGEVVIYGAYGLASVVRLDHVGRRTCHNVLGQQ